MLNCEYCDYLKKSERVSGDSDSEPRYFCEFADFVFGMDVNESDMEYPCRDISYQDYLNRRGKVNELPSIIRGNDWKVLYKNRHAVPERKRSLIAV